MTARYAVYFAPDPASPLTRFGASWLGYDVASGAPVAQPAVAGIAAERLRAITAEPRRYGFHATLKPPFALAEGKRRRRRSTWRSRHWPADFRRSPRRRCAWRAFRASGR